MESYFSPNVFIPILICAAAGIIYYIYLKFKSKVKDKIITSELGEEIVVEELEEGEPVYCRIADNTTGRIYNADIPYKDIKKTIEIYHTLGRRWKRDNKDIYGLCKLEDGTYKPILIPSAMSNAPSTLYMDMRQPEIEILMDMREDKPFLEKYGMVLWWVAIMAFIMVMMVNS